MAHPLTTCTFCGAGCGLHLVAEDGRVVGAYPSRTHPASRGRLCVRGWHVHEIAAAPDRLLRPRVRKGGELVEVSWDEALAFVAGRLRAIRDEHGPDALAFLCSPRCSNEEAYLLQKLARTVIGTNNVDHGAGVYANHAGEVLLEVLGAAASTCSFADLDASDAVLVHGLELSRQLPTVAGRVLRARLAGAHLVLVGTRRQRLADHAQLFLQPEPGTEAALYAAMAKVIVDRGLWNGAFLRERCRGAEAFLEAVRRVDVLGVAEACGVPAAAIEEAALVLGRARAATILFSTGEVADPAVVRGLVNLALLTGNVGRDGAGILALAEHNNLQGVCDVGVLPARLPGYRPVASAAARAALAERWGVRPPAIPGASAEAVLTDRAGGRVRGVWLTRYDPVSTAAVGAAARALSACELVVVQHLFDTATARLAHAVLPVAAFGEEEVTYTSAERRIQLAAQVVAAPGEARPAWRQLADLGRALGAPWTYHSSAEVMDELAQVVPFYGGAHHAALAHGHGRQWPVTAQRPLGTRHLLAEPDPERALVLSPPAPSPHSGPRRDPAYPFTLLLDHASHYWNQNVLVQHSETLRREHRILLLDYPDGFVEVNDADARALGVRDGEHVRLRAAGGGAASAAARVTSEIRAGTVVVPFFLREVQEALGAAAGPTPAEAGEGDARAIHVLLERETP